MLYVQSIFSKAGSWLATQFNLKNYSFKSYTYFKNVLFGLGAGGGLDPNKKCGPEPTEYVMIMYLYYY